MMGKNDVTPDFVPKTIFPDDVFIVSYPKSGSTWLRFLIGNYLSENQCRFSNVQTFVPDVPYDIK